MSVTQGHKVAIYCRVSTLGQKVEGESLEVQEEKLKRYAIENKLEIQGIYKESCSGAIRPQDRPQFKIIFAMLQAKLISGIIVTKIDRLSRSIKDFINLIEIFKDNEWKFYSMYPDVNPDTAQGKFFLHLIIIIAELERDMTSERVKDVLALKRSLHEVSGTIPFGKRLNPETKKIEDDEEEMRTIRIALDKRNEMTKNRRGKVKQTTYKEVCEHLVKMGRHNREGLIKWHPSQIRNFVKNQKKNSN